MASSRCVVAADEPLPVSWSRRPWAKCASAVARVHGAALADELEQRLALPPSGGQYDDAGSRRVHQPLHRRGHEAVVDEDVLLDAERRVAAFEVAGAVALDAVAQRRILRARRRANLGRPARTPAYPSARCERGRREEAAGDREAAEDPSG